MLKRSSIIKFISVVVTTVVLSGCTAMRSPDESLVNVKIPLIPLDNAPLSASQYLNDAKKAKTPEQHSRFMLLASHAFINQNDATNALKTLAATKPKLTPKPELQAEYKYLSARALVLTSAYKKALAILNYPPQWQLPTWQLINYHRLKAELYQETHQPIEQVRQLSPLSSYLLPTEQANQINDKIWRILQQLDESTLTAATTSSGSAMFIGWLQLAYIGKHYGTTPEALVQHIARWQQDNPNHPAAIRLPHSLKRALATKPYQPKNIAVLLPLSGRHAAIANAVKQGILASYLAKANKAEITVNFFDSSKGAQQAYQQALDSGAQFIIGPLLQQQVNDLLQADASTAEAGKQIPQLYLNHTSKASPKHDHFFFTLSTTNEAMDAAQKMFDSGIKKPIVLSSNDNIGRRMATAFKRQWSLLTQKQSEIYYYKRGNRMKVAVEQALGVTRSKQRIKSMKRMIGDNLKADFRSRRDIDAIYMIANSQDILLLKPFIDVNFSVFATPVPLYASSRSRSNSDSSHVAPDLNNIIIGDIPWLLKSTPKTAAVTQLWPSWHDSQKRLYSMGYDAFSLISQLAQMQALSNYKYSGYTGVLSVLPNGTINRQLSWGRYHNGHLQPL